MLGCCCRPPISCFGTPAAAAAAAAGTLTVAQQNALRLDEQLADLWRSYGPSIQLHEQQQQGHSEAQTFVLQRLAAVQTGVAEASTLAAVPLPRAGAPLGGPPEGLLEGFLEGLPEGLPEGPFPSRVLRGPQGGPLGGPQGGPLEGPLGVPLGFAVRLCCAGASGGLEVFELHLGQHHGGDRGPKAAS